jgi:hypothetical protein
MTDVRVKAAERGQLSGGRPVSVRRPVVTVATVMAVMAALFASAWLSAGGAAGLGHLAMAIGCLAAGTGLVCIIVAVSMRQLTRPVEEVRDR